MIMLLRLMQRHRIRPVVLLGGATTKIGDPTGKDQIRNILPDAELSANTLGIKETLGKFISFANADLVNNDDWLGRIGYLELLSCCGRLISVNRMLKMDSVRSRLEREQSLSFLEFNYLIMQAYDFLYLNKQFNCVLQCGGSDQWSNILGGVDLIERTTSRKAFGLTTPLITTASGKKMGKTEAGAVWLDHRMTSQFDYYQYWRNVHDEDVARFLKMFTDLELAEIAEIEKRDINEQKKILAIEATKICHGSDAALQVAGQATSLFELKSLEAARVVELPMSVRSKSVADLLCEAKLCASKSEARRLIAGNAIKLNGSIVTNTHALLSEFLSAESDSAINCGKKKAVRVRFV